MNIIDILVLLLLVFSLWRGWKSGILVQLSGIVGIVAGVWVAYNFWRQIAAWLAVDTAHRSLLFAAILLAVLILVIILCHLLTRLLRFGGLSVPIKLLGIVFSAAKTVILLALIFTAFEYINEGDRLTDASYLREALCHRPLKAVSEFIFPYLERLTGTVESIFV